MDATIWPASLFTKWIILDHLWRDAQHIAGPSQTSITLCKWRNINSALLRNKASLLKEWLCHILFFCVAWQPTCAGVGKRWKLNELMSNKHRKVCHFMSKSIIFLQPGNGWNLNINKNGPEKKNGQNWNYIILKFITVSSKCCELRISGAIVGVWFCLHLRLFYIFLYFF